MKLKSFGMMNNSMTPINNSKIIGFYEFPLLTSGHNPPK